MSPPPKVPRICNPIHLSKQRALILLIACLSLFQFAVVTFWTSKDDVHHFAYFLPPNWHSSPTSTSTNAANKGLSVTNLRHGHTPGQTEFSERRSPNTLPPLICKLIPPSKSAASLWQRYQPIILQGLQHPLDTNGIHNQWIQALLHTVLTPSKLQSSLRILPKLPKQFERILRKLDAHLLDENESPPPIHIHIMGGSIVEGTGCNQWNAHLAPRNEDTKLMFSDPRTCAWPFRLQHLLNHVSKHLMPQEAFQVHNLAQGGTHSGQAVAVLKYWLSPELQQTKGAVDVLIHAYAANDNLPPAFHASDNTTVDLFHFTRLLLRQQQFLEASMQHGNKCDDHDLPLAIYLDDYLGNQQESLVGEGTLNEVIDALSSIHPFVAHISPAHMVRPWVLANMTETNFSPRWFGKRGKKKIDVHFGMVGHVVNTIVLAYAFLEMTVNYCQEQHQLQEPRARDDIQKKMDVLRKLETATTKNVPILLTRNLPASQMGSSQRSYWTFDELTLATSTTSVAAHAPSQPCAFAFLAAPLGTHQAADTLEDYLQQYAVSNTGWQAQNDFRQGGFQNKLGLVATQPNSRLVLEVPSTTTTSIVTVHYMKSYGEQWAKSKARIKVQRPHQEETAFVLSGYHNQTTSISYEYQAELTKNANDGKLDDDKLRIELELIGGTTFKVNALMVCSY